MGIWIRSQHKSNLVKCEEIEIRENKIYGNQHFLGKYETEERAIKIVDLIQERVIKGSKFDDIYNGKRTTREFVFQMPEK